jgi:hypothetical protein
MREQLVSGDVAARKAYLASIIDAVIVSENKSRIMGSNDNGQRSARNGNLNEIYKKYFKQPLPAEMLK